MNGILWRVRKVDPLSPKLVDRTGTRTVATTDPIWHFVNVSNVLNGDMFSTVVIHELGHCALVSYNLLDYIHERVPKEYWVDMEEFICNFIADYGLKIFGTMKELYGDKALEFIPASIEKYIA